MHAFIIFAKSKEHQEEELARILSAYKIDKVDITRIVPQKAIGIETIRELKRSISLAPFRGETKAVIIEEAQMLTVEAQNALLKTLEEPPARTIIILTVSTNIDALLPTVVSRCQVVQLSTINYQLSTSELSTLNSQLLMLLENGVGKKLKLAEDIAKDRQSAILWLKNMIIATRQVFIDTLMGNPTDASPATTNAPLYLQWLNSLQKAHTLLSTSNVNPRFTLETLFLSLKPFH